MNGQILNYEPIAKKRFMEWDLYNTSLINDKKIPSHIRSIYSKFNVYIHRFSLIMQTLYWACNEENLEVIILKSVESAIELVEYFKKNAMTAQNIISNDISDISSNKDLAKIMQNKGYSYRDIANILNISKSTVGNLLK